MVGEICIWLKCTLIIYVKYLERNPILNEKLFRVNILLKCNRFRLNNYRKQRLFSFEDFFFIKILIEI